MDGKLEQSSAISKANLETSQEPKRGSILKLFKAIWNCRHFENKDSKGAFWWYLKQLGTAEKILKTGTLNGAF